MKHTSRTKNIRSRMNSWLVAMAKYQKVISKQSVVRPLHDLVLVSDQRPNFSQYIYVL